MIFFSYNHLLGIIEESTMKDQYFGDINDYRKYDFIQCMLETLRNATPDSFVEAFSTPHVVFLMALQPEHQDFHKAIVSSVQENWEGQIHHWELTSAQQGAPVNRSFAARARVG
jgi:uncharacterized protein YcgL (UPF0745 family)